MSETRLGASTQEMPDQALDIGEVRSFLASRYPRWDGNVSQVGRGEWSVAYAFLLEGHHYVVRFGRERDDFEKDRLAAAHASPALPIPRVIQIGEAFDAYYAVSDRVFGVHLDSLGEADMRQVLPSLFAALDGTRCSDVSGSAGYGRWDATGNAPYTSWHAALLDVGNDHPAQRTSGWRERMAAAPLGCGPFDEALDCLRTLLRDCPEDRHLLHSDPLNRNIFVRDGRITGVIDWRCAMYGDFVYDLAHFSFAPIWYPAWAEIDVAGEALRHYDAIALDVPRFRQRLRCYELHIGLVASAYNAFRGRWDELELTLRRTLQSVAAPP